MLRWNSDLGETIKSADASDDEALRRESAIATALADVLRRRAAGEELGDAGAIADYPELMPELLERLATIPSTRKADITSRRAGKAGEGIAILTAEALESPITSNDGPSDNETKKPSIDGYQLLSEIGSGGQALVYEAVQESTGKHVAVKVMHGGALAGSRHRARFDREAAVLASIDHPNVVGIIDRGRMADGSFYLVLPLLRGVPFDQYVAAESPSDDALIRLWIKVARAVEEAHARGIVHRDLKPSNVLVDVRGEPHILDFGLARDSDSTATSAAAMTSTGQIVGSLPWLSPEQVTSVGTIDVRSDVFSLGVMMYQTIARRHPYDLNGRLADTIKNIEYLNPPPPSRVTGNRGRQNALRRRLDSIVLRALSKEATDRYSSAGALADDLDAVLGGKRPVVNFGRSRRRGRRAIFALMLLAALAMAFGVLLKIRVRGNPGELANTLEMHLVQISAGSFYMGSDLTDAGHRDNERRHHVRISHPFFISATEVTRRQYVAIMPAPKAWGTKPFKEHDLDLPADAITWQDAVAFCQQLGRREGRQYRLPTEAEWEYVARAGVQSTNTIETRLTAEAWFRDNSDNHLHPVATKRANEWGLFDMCGNAAEWCSDYYEPLYPDNAGIVLLDPVGPAAGITHVVKGGNAFEGFDSCRVAARTGYPPSTAAVGLGFRVVLDPNHP